MLLLVIVKQIHSCKKLEAASLLVMVVDSGAGTIDAIF
jgi:hypothetical protein